MMDVILFFAIFIPIMLLAFGYLNFSCHRSMTRDSAKPFRRGSAGQFKAMFEKINWEFDPMFPKSLFTEDSQIHARRFRFHSQNMLLGPIAFVQASFIIRRKLNSIRTKRENKSMDWDDIAELQKINDETNQLSLGDIDCLTREYGTTSTGGKCEPIPPAVPADYDTKGS